MNLYTIKGRIKHALYRLFRPALMDVNTRLERLEQLVSAGGSDIGSASQAKQGVTSIWRGGIDGKAIWPNGQEDCESTIKYRNELSYWVEVVKTPEKVKGFPGPFEETYGGWQRDRIKELQVFMGLDEKAFKAWTRKSSAVEIGAGPYPSISEARWLRAVAVDPIADGYTAEGLLPKAAKQVTYIASPGEAINLPSGFADIVVIENCLDHVADPAAVVAEIHRLLAPGGVMWLLVDLMDYSDEMHPNPFNKDRLDELLNRGGFDAVKDRVSDHKSHPQAYGEYRGLLRKRSAKGKGGVEVVTKVREVAEAAL